MRVHVGENTTGQGNHSADVAAGLEMSSKALYHPAPGFQIEQIFLEQKGKQD